ncbi:MAG: signal recognition particle-docking protein FtsY [Pseudomonadales bacterium]|nr:signal recognition particle-docking protein FtsY [Pseudomonadales bacterium]
MFGFGKKQTPGQSSGADASEKQGSPHTQTADEETQEKPRQGGFFGRLIAGLGKTRAALSSGLGALILGSRAIDEDLLEEIEVRLLTADVGIEATDQIINHLKARLKRKQVASGEDLLNALKAELVTLLRPVDEPLQISSDRPFVILVVGVNGVGKTTTIGKLCRYLEGQQLKPVLAAGDTFRAAAVEQLQEWGARNNVPVVAQATGADSASVIFDAYQSARARGADVMIADTAGRLHTKDNLMQELEKISRVLRKQGDALPHETLLVLDATTGQNALNQARSFHKAVNLTGVCLTKLDGTAKGGMVFAIAKELGLPIRFIGVGEKIDDLRPFSAEQFVEALFAE